MLEDQVQIYEQVADWDLPNTLASLRAITDELHVTLEEKQQLAELGDIKQQLATVQQENKELRRQLAGFILESSAITLKAGETVTLVDGYYVLGLQSFTGPYANIILNNDFHVMSVAEYIEIDDRALGLDCRLYLTGVSVGESAEFEFVCFPAQ